MQKKEIITVSLIAVVTAIVALVVSGILFGSPVDHKTKVADVPAITSSFPDIRNDPAYSSFLNKNALDPALPVQVGNSQNKTPFNNR